MITLTGLTQQQVEICDQLWACDSMEAVKEFINSMPTPSLKVEAKAMYLMILAATVDDEIQTEEDCSEAQSLLSKFRG